MRVPQVWPFSLHGTESHPQAIAPEAVIERLSKLVAEDGGGARRASDRVLELEPVARPPLSFLRMGSRVASFSQGTFSVATGEGRTSVTYSVPNTTMTLVCLVGPALMLLTRPPHGVSEVGVLGAYFIGIYVFDAAVSRSRVQSIVREALESATTPHRPPSVPAT